MRTSTLTSIACAAALALSGLAAGATLVRSVLARPPASDGESWALLRVNAASAPGEAGRVRVGVVDSGVDAAHPALRGRVLDGIDFVDGGPGTHDPLGHGTQVAGIIAGRGVGVAETALIVPVRVVDARGSGTVKRLAVGIRWAADSDVRVINASVEASGPAATLEEALDYAWARRAVVVAISGNQGGAVQWPAAYPKAIAVGALDRGDSLARFSGRGVGLDLVAPGVGIPTLVAGGGYANATGTSTAAPFVAGAAALLLGQEPGLTNDELIERLRGSARDLGHAGPDARYGAGMLDIAAALAGDIA
jgi:subtilisin family serine protease